MLLESTGRRTSIEFTNAAGQGLVGMYYHPAAETARDLAVVIPVNSIKYRAGSFRYHYLLARRLCDLGFPVFCFDPACIGDSEGALPRQRVEATFIEIQNGAHVDDTVRALDLLQERFDHRRFLMFGLCGGAITATMTSARDERIAGAILLGIPILYDRDPAQKRRRKQADKEPTVTSDRVAKNVLRRKATAVFDIQVWKKLFRGGYREGTEFREAFQSVQRLAGQLFGRVARSRRSATIESLLAEPLSDRDRYNFKLQQALLTVWNRGAKTLLVFGSLDPVTGDFEDAFLLPATEAVPGITDLHEHVVIENANHIFSAADSQVELTETILDWIRRY